MTLKYGRMGHIIPCINDDPIIEKIVDVHCRWQKEIVAKYPNLMQRARAVDSGEDTDHST